MKLTNAVPRLKQKYKRSYVADVQSNSAIKTTFGTI